MESRDGATSSPPNASSLALASTTIAGMELPHRIGQGQYNLSGLAAEGKAVPEIWLAVLTA